MEHGADLVLVRFGELALKGGNRAMFERLLAQNIRAALAPITAARIERRRGRLLVRPERRVDEAARRLQDVFGIASVSPAWSTPATPEAIVRTANVVLADALAELPVDRPITFRVASSRADKRFPLTSSELDRHVADRLESPHVGRLRVQLERPELALGIDVRDEGAYVFARKLPGPGGLPVGSLGRALCLLSGGIDSPVAAWMAMKRGCSVSFVSFHSYPYLGESSKRKIADLVRVLARWQPQSRLFVLPFTAIQTAIRDTAPEPYRTVLYRRMMQRLASRVARRAGAQVLVTGESLGQVASQTMENLACIEAASELPVLRPLVCFDKDETIAIARRIGTFDVSTLPEPDCCTVFQPSRPVIRGRIDECEAAERELDLEGLVEEALEGIESHHVDP